MADLIIIAYDSEEKAEAARNKILELQKEYLIEIGDAVVAVRREDGHIKLQARKVVDSIDTSTVVGLRDRALISVMTFAFARVGAVVAMRVEDYYPKGKRWRIRLHEKGGKRHEMPAHHNLEAYLDAYIGSAGIREGGKAPLFRYAAGRTSTLTEKPMNRVDAWRMIQRRAADLCTRVTAYLEAGGTLENAQAMAAHESPRTTKLYDRTSDEITLDEVERIAIWFGIPGVGGSPDDLFKIVRYGAFRSP